MKTRHHALADLGGERYATPSRSNSSISCIFGKIRQILDIGAPCLEVPGSATGMTHFMLGCTHTYTNARTKDVDMQRACKISLCTFLDVLLLENYTAKTLHYLYKIRVCSYRVIPKSKFHTHS